MASRVGGSLRQGKKARDNQGYDQSLSKLVALGEKYRLIFPKFEIQEEVVAMEDGEEVNTLKGTGEWDIRAAVVMGRTLNYKACGTGFIPYTDDMLNFDESTQQYSDATNLGLWARISGVLYEANYKREIKNAEAEAQRLSEETGQEIDRVSLQRKIEGIELRYHGGVAADGKTKVSPTESKDISGLQYKISTRIGVIKMKPDGTPDFKNAVYGVFEVSKTRQDELIALLDNPDYNDPNKSYIEVGYDYIGTDKKLAGKNAKFQGIANSISLSITNPDAWKEYGEAFVNGILPAKTEDEAITFLRSRNSNLRGGSTPNDIAVAYKKYLATNQAVFGSIDFEAEETGRAAKDFIELGLVDKLPKCLEKFKEIIAKRDAQSAGEETESTVSQADMSGTTEESKEAAAMEAAKALSDSAEQTLRTMVDYQDVELSGDEDLGDL